MYRVSSRSFPNREITKISDALSVVPLKGFESDIYENPYISYNCLRNNIRFAVVGNGTHTDPIFENLEAGMSMRDSMITVLSGMDYEHDDLCTPRISAIVDSVSRKAALGAIRKDGIEVLEFNLKPGSYRYVTTYEHNHLYSEYGGQGLTVNSAEEASSFVVSGGKFELFQKPVSSAAAIESGNGFTVASSNIVEPS